MKKTPPTTRFVRPLAKGMGEAVAARTVFRPGETWADVASRVSHGNALLDPRPDVFESERQVLDDHIANGSILLSGRHLQHGDAGQPQRNLEVYSNCSTAATSFLLFYLLLNGCFQKGTLVKMIDGTHRPIEEIKAGDQVVSFDETERQFVQQTVERLNVNAPKPMVKITLENGRTVVCTQDHKFLTVDGEWVEARHLNGRDIKEYAGN